MPIYFDLSRINSSSTKSHRAINNFVEKRKKILAQKDSIF